MKIRKALPEDTNEIVEVLKASLGEKDLPLSDIIWNYKHQNNPFGKSIVLVAEENDRIIGVRAFMKWQWQRERQLFHGYRAVDTATHPDHQGKGIFKKLTLSAVETATDTGDHFIFNTPNEKSRPGYLKMGWIRAGKIKVGIIPSFFLVFKKYRKNPTYKTHNIGNENELDRLCNSWNNYSATEGKLFCPKSPTYLNWRFRDNPLQSYEIISTPEYYLAAYIKKRRNLRELRIAECIVVENVNRPKVKEVIQELSWKLGAHFITASPDVKDLNFLMLQGNFGPYLTLKNLNLSRAEFLEIHELENWKPSLGDLELF